MKQRMFIPVAVAAFLFLPFIVAGTQAEDFGTDARSRAINIEEASKNIRKAIEFASTASDRDENREVLKAMIRYSLHLLRGPEPDGVSYRYAEVDMGNKVEAVKHKSEMLSAVWKDGQMQVVAIEGSAVYGFKIYTPLQRGFFKNNGNMYLDSYRVEYTLNGITRMEEREYRQYVTRDSTINVPLPGIAESARLEITVGVDPSDVNHVLVHLLAKYPAVKDSPMNPFSFPIEQLKDSFVRLENGRRPKEIVKYHEAALEGIAKVPEALSDAPADDIGSRDELVKKLEMVLYLLKGSEEDRAEAVEDIKKLIRGLKRK